MKRIVATVLLMVMCVLLMGAQIQSGATSDLLTVDATSKAARVTLYDPRGNHMGERATYSAGLTVKTATTAGTGPFFTICGSGTRTVRVKRFNMNGTVATAATRSEVILKKTSTATSGGTATALTQVPHDSTSPAGTASAVNFYTALATAGTSVGVVGSLFRGFPITATIASTDVIPELLWDFRSDETEAIILRGTAQCMEANFGTSTTNAPTLTVEVTWTEE